MKSYFGRGAARQLALAEMTLVYPNSESSWGQRFALKAGT
jgi:hypothetical protein